MLICCVENAIVITDSEDEDSDSDGDDVPNVERIDLDAVIQELINIRSQIDQLLMKLI